MSSINVDAHIISIFREWIYVNRGVKQYCTCDLDDMMPVHPANYQRTNELVCAECGKLVSDEMRISYDRFHKYNGFDDEV